MKRQNALFRIAFLAYGAAWAIASYFAIRPAIPDPEEWFLLMGYAAVIGGCIAVYSFLAAYWVWSGRFPRMFSE